MPDIETIPASFQMLLAIFSAPANLVPMDAAVYTMFACISFFSRKLDVPEWQVFILFALIKAWFGHH